MLGCTHIRNTFIHAVEELLDVPERLTENPVDFQIKMPDGSIKEVSVHRHYNRMTAHISEEYDKSDDAAAEAAYETAMVELQKKDKLLELRLEQVQTQQQAVEKEMESVKDVIKKNIENGFKTFA